MQKALLGLNQRGLKVVRHRGGEARVALQLIATHSHVRIRNTTPECACVIRVISIGPGQAESGASIGRAAEEGCAQGMDRASSD